MVAQSSSSTKWVASLDMYRKVPGDLVEGSKEGRIASWLAIGIMLWLFVNETSDFLRPKVSTHMAIDKSKIDKLQVYFNITMLDLVSYKRSIHVCDTNEMS